MKPTAINIRKLNPQDFDEVLWIENVSFDDPWKKADFQRCIKMGCWLMVATQNGKVVGYVVIQFLKDRIELVNLAVEPTHRRSGIGRRLVEWAQRQVQVFSKSSISLTVRETNLNAQLFFRALCIPAVRVIRNPFQDLEEDGFYFVWKPRSGEKFWPFNRISFMFPANSVTK